MDLDEFMPTPKNDPLKNFIDGFLDEMRRIHAEKSGSTDGPPGLPIPGPARDDQTERGGVSARTPSKGKEAQAVISAYGDWQKHLQVVVTKTWDGEWGDAKTSLNKAVRSIKEIYEWGAIDEAPFKRAMAFMQKVKESLEQQDPEEVAKWLTEIDVNIKDQIEHDIVGWVLEQREE